ncbi:MAG TPA: L-threonylcarbamoyladenylate synthase [Thermoleophilaceae bacterium]|jgi:L-threonylcarbamoyladenylate synthase
MTPEDVERFERALAAGGVGLFPADTVYGLAADAESETGVRRLYEIKGRPQERPAAVMFFDPEPAFAALDGIGPRTRGALSKLLPGPVTAVIPNPRRLYPLACGPAPERLGIRIPGLRPGLEAMLAIRRPVLQSSANPTGGADPRRLADVDPAVRAAAGAELDGGELPGTPSTVVDLTTYEESGDHRVLRAGAVSAEVLADLL